MSSALSWIVCVAVLLTILVYRLRTAGPRAAVGTISMCLLLVPAWVVWHVFGQPVNVRVVVMLLTLGLYDIHPAATFRTKLTWADFAALALIAVHILSDWYNDGVDWLVPIRAYCEWALPYLSGRLALQTVDDVRRLLPGALLVGVLLSVISVTEAVTRENPVESVFGERPEELALRSATRWNIKRAFGPTMHSIFFGLLQLLMCPWGIYAAHRARKQTGPGWWVMFPFLSAAGILCSGSRAPILGIPIVAGTILFVVFHQYRKMMAIAAGAALVGMVVGAPYVVRAMETWGAEESARSHRFVIVDEEKVRISNTMGRVYLFEVYGLAMRKAGWLGFGTTRTTGFPVNVPVGEKHVENQKRVPWIDNEYVLLVLRFGYLGCMFFILFAAATVLNFYQLARTPNTPGGIFFGATAGALLATFLLLLSVWMPYDFGFLLLWYAGASSGLRGKVPDPFRSDTSQSDRGRSESRRSSERRSSSSESSTSESRRHRSHRHRSENP